MTAQVIPFRRAEAKPDPLAYGPGVAPFDRTNPAHVGAWNAMWVLAESERRWAEKYGEDEPC